MDSEANIESQATFGCTATVVGDGMGLVEATGIRLGTITEIPNEEAAWKRVDELGLKPYSPDRPRNPRITFGEVAAHYVKFELPDDQSNATIEKSQSCVFR